MTQALSGYRVLDLTHVLAGPFCTYQLALLGAEVIKIEHPAYPDCARGRGPVPDLNEHGLGLNYLVQASNKKSVTLDLSAPTAQAAFLRLAATADVVVENYRVGALARFGLAAADLRRRFPRLIHCSITGFGQIGARAQVNAYDNVVQAASGVMSQTGHGAGHPMKIGGSFVDYATGLNAAFAITAALLRRERTGAGQSIDCAMFDTAVQMMAPEAAARLYPGPQRPLPNEAGLGAYRARDGVVVLGAFNPRQNRRFWNALQRPDFAQLSSWSEIWEQAQAMRSALEPLMLTRTCREWEEWLHSLGIPGERVRTLQDAVAMPHLAERGFFHEWPSLTAGSAPVTVPVSGFRCDVDGPRVTSPPAALGSDTLQVLADLGLNAAQIEESQAGAPQPGPVFA